MRARLPLADPYALIFLGGLFILIGAWALINGQYLPAVVFVVIAPPIPLWVGFGFLPIEREEVERRSRASGGADPAD